MSRCIGLLGSRSMEVCKAKKRCDGFFSTDVNLRKGCRDWVKTLDKPQDFKTANQYLEVQNQGLLIATYGVDLITNDETTTDSVFGESSNIYLFFGGLVLLLILILWIRLQH